MATNTFLKFYWVDEATLDSIRKSETFWQQTCLGEKFQQKQKKNWNVEKQKKQSWHKVLLPCLFSFMDIGGATMEQVPAKEK